MRRIRKCLLLKGISLLILLSCKTPVESWDSIKIVNNTNKDIYVSAGIRRYGMYSYPDTLLPIERPSLVTVRAGKSNFLRSGPDWESAIRNSNNSDSLSIYLFDIDTVIQYDWNKIRADYKVLKRSDLSIADLKRMEWTLTYP